MDSAIGIIGHAATGKTTLAHALSKAVGGDIVSFGDAVRQKAEEEGLDPSDRKVLMRLGQSWVDSDVEDYCRTVLAQRHEDSEILIIEGIRHEAVRATLSRLLEPVSFASVLLKAPYDVLVDRMVSEKNLLSSDVQQVLSDPTETQVDQLLLGAADLILDATESVAHNVHEVLTWLSERELRASGEQPVDYLKTFEPTVFDDDERSDLVNAVSAEFDMLLMKEVSERVGSPTADLSNLRASHYLLALDFGSQQLVPGFQLKGDVFDQEVTRAIHVLSAEMTNWEIVAWMISNSGKLDGLRPIDLPRQQLVDFARRELDV
jgi:cytidylate kinase